MSNDVLFAVFGHTSQFFEANRLYLAQTLHDKYGFSVGESRQVMLALVGESTSKLVKEGAKILFSRMDDGDELKEQNAKLEDRLYEIECSRNSWMGRSAKQDVEVEKLKAKLQGWKDWAKTQKDDPYTEDCTHVGHSILEWALSIWVYNDSEGRERLVGWDLITKKCFGGPRELIMKIWVKCGKVKMERLVKIHTEHPLNGTREFGIKYV